MVNVSQNGVKNQSDSLILTSKREQKENAPEVVIKNKTEEKENEIIKHAVNITEEALWQALDKQAMYNYTANKVCLKSPVKADSTQSVGGVGVAGSAGGTSGVVEADSVTSAKISAVQTKVSNAVNAFQNNNITPFMEIKAEYGNKIEISVEQNKNNRWTLKVKLPEFYVDMTATFTKNITNLVNVINSVVQADGTSSVSGANGTGGVNGTNGIIETDSVSSMERSSIECKVIKALNSLEYNDKSLLNNLKAEYGNKIEISVIKSLKDTWYINVKIPNLSINKLEGYNKSMPFFSEMAYGSVQADNVASVPVKSASQKAAESQINDVIRDLENYDINSLIELKRKYGNALSIAVEQPSNCKFKVINIKISGLNIDEKYVFNNKNIDTEKLTNIINHTNFPDNVTGKEALDIINKFADYYKSSLKKQYGYSEEYLGILSYFIDSLYIEDDDYYYYCNDLLGTFIKNVRLLTNPPIDDGDITIRYDGLMISGKNHIIGNYINDYIKTKQEELNLSTEEVEFCLCQIFKDMGADQFIWFRSNYWLTVENYFKLGNDTRDFTGFHVLFDIINEKLSSIKQISYSERYNAKTINSYALFNSILEGKNYCDASDLLEHYYDLQLSDDPGVRKFVQILDNAFHKFDAVYNIDKEEVVRHLIEFLNVKSGQTNNNSKLSKDTINILNQQNIFDIIQEIIDSQEFYIANMVNVDGNIGEFYQGNTGDCWLLSALKALSSSYEGQKIIKQQISWANDYSSVTVYFAGVDKYITISAEEIVETKEERRLSKGDDDVIILELAMEKVYGDINGNWENTFWSRFVRNAKIQTDKFVNGDSNKLKNWLTNLLQTQEKGGGFAACFNLESNGEAGCSCSCINGSKFSYNSNGAHAFAITRINSATVTFINPWYSETEYTVSWNEFISLRAFSTDTVYF